MRIKALGGGIPLPAIVAFVCAGTLTFFFTVLMVLCLVTAAMADPILAPQCAIDRAVYTKAMAQAKHPLLLEFPPDLSRRFITAWNGGMRGFGVPPIVNNVTVYDYPKIPYFRLAFFKDDCLVEAFDIPEGIFWQAVGAADNTKWRI